MKKELGTGITIAILLVSFLLIGATTASVLIGNTQSEGTLSPDDLEQMVNDLVDDISTYVKIHDVYGKYYPTENGLLIQRIVIPMKLYISGTVDLSGFTIQLNNGNQLLILSYCGQAEYVESHSLYTHPLWDSLNQNTFGFLITIDDDQSIVNYHTLDKNTDAGFLLINLPDDFMMKKGDTMHITIVPPVGTPRTIEVLAPLPIKSIVSLGPE